MPQLKLFPGFFERKHNDTIVIRSIIKKLLDTSQNRSYLISEVGQIVRLLLLSQAKNAESVASFLL